MAFVQQGKTAVVKKSPKGKFNGCGMVNVVSKEANKIIMAAKRQERQAKKQGVVATELDKEELD